jgi:hypothetical protein
MSVRLLLLVFLALSSLGATAPPSIHIVRRLGPAERERLARQAAAERRERGPRIAAWCRGYQPALLPLRTAAGEALASLRLAWGPFSRNLGYPVETAVASLVARQLLPAPDPALDRQLAHALLRLAEGASACQRGLPTIALWRLEEGWAALAEVDRLLAAWAGEGWGCQEGRGEEKEGRRGAP